MRFTVRFRIGNRLGAASSYGLRDICVSLVDKYGLRDAELLTIFTLPIGGAFSNEDMVITRKK